MIRSLKKLVPPLFRDRVKKEVDYRKLRVHPTVICDSKQLRALKLSELRRILAADAVGSEWDEARKILSRAGVVKVSGGVSEGEKRAIYQLVRGLPACRVLEIGTHVGASTAAIALALKNNKSKAGVFFETVDMYDVNAEPDKSKQFGLVHTPKTLIEKIGCSDFCKFTVSNAQQFLKTTDRKYDLIFLDGDHSSKGVYNEIALALSCLNENGVILLHDYAWSGKKVWDDLRPIWGPYLAVGLHQERGAGFSILPMRELEWETRAGVRKTCLAVMSRASALD